MKAFFAFSIYVILLLTSCDRSDESAFAIKQKIAAAERAVIHFENGKKVHVNSTEAFSLKLLKEAVQEEELEETKCAADGKIDFFKGEILLESISFSAKPDCSFVHFMHNNEPRTKVISEEAKKYLSHTASQQ